MTPKERAAMQQALECLNTLISHHTVCYSAISESGAVDAEYALREALGNSLKRKCFADYQPNHAIDRACASCAIATVCQTGEQAEQQDYVAIADGTFNHNCPLGTLLYAAPPIRHPKTDDLQREWVEPSDEQIYDVCKDVPFVVIGPDYDKEIARSVLKLAKELNHV